MTQASAAVKAHPARPQPRGPGRAWYWLRQGLGLWRGAVWQGLLLALLPLVFEGLLQWLPMVGLVLSKLLTPLVAALTLWWLHRRCQRAGSLPVYGLPGWPVAVTVMLLGLFVFAWQLVVLALLAGPDSALSLEAARAKGVASPIAGNVDVLVGPSMESTLMMLRTLLALGGELLVRGAVGMAARLGISPLLAGLTIVGFGTSTPELATSVQAMQGTITAYFIAFGLAQLLYGPWADQSGRSRFEINDRI